MTEIRLVMLSGGAGTRLWPLSREGYPKQFLPLGSEATMLQETWLRAAPLAVSAPIVIANEEHRFLVAEQLRLVSVSGASIVLEPVGRNTAPAIAAAAMQATRDGSDPLLLVLPSDHVVRDAEGFRSAVREASAAAESGTLVTFGVLPSSPETGFGYIMAAEGEGAGRVRRVLRFVEKPDADTAKQYLETGEYFWNSGMFLFRASRYLEELERIRPDICEGVLRSFEARTQDGDFIRLGKDAFASTPSESIDYAVMEHTEDAGMLPIDVGWNDIGSWSALWRISPHDSAGNACFGDVVAIDSRNNYAYARRMVAMVGVDDLIVVETDDAVLVAHKEKVQLVKEVVARLRDEQRSHVLLHREVHRPWGSYDSIDSGRGFQVKRIKVKPGARLSLQSHNHRAEHWVVVRGTARVTRDNDVFQLSANQSTYIPVGAKHRLENPGEEILELIEVQSGDYLGEDDIIRYEDLYGRA